MGEEEEMSEEDEDTGVVPSAQQEKKTEKQRKKEKADKLKVKHWYLRWPMGSWFTKSLCIAYLCSLTLRLLQ